jgi:hypothetical protein
LLVLLIIEALITRTEWKLPSFSLASRTPKVPKLPKTKAPAKSPPPSRPLTPIDSEPPASAPPAQPDIESQERRSRFQKAKDRK